MDFRNRLPYITVCFILVSFSNGQGNIFMFDIDTVLFSKKQIYLICTLRQFLLPSAIICYYICTDTDRVITIFLISLKPELLRNPVRTLEEKTKLICARQAANLDLPL